MISSPNLKLTGLISERVTLRHLVLQGVSTLLGRIALGAKRPDLGVHTTFRIPKSCHVRCVSPTERDHRAFRHEVLVTVVAIERHQVHRDSLLVFSDFELVSSAPE